MKSTFKTKLHRAFLEVVFCVVAAPFFWMVVVSQSRELPRLKHFVYHTGIFPYGDVGYGWVVTTLAGGVSFVSGVAAVTLLSWFLQSTAGKAEVKTISLFSHNRECRYLSREGAMLTFTLLGFHAIYLLIFCFQSFWNDGPLTTALEDVCTGYVLSALVASGSFVLVLALSNVLVKLPQLEFQRLGCHYFFKFYGVFWWILLATAIFGPVWPSFG